MVELRRIALINQSANLVNAHEQLKRLADNEEFKHHPERISANNKRTQRRLKELEDDDVDPAIRRINAIDWARYPTKENSFGEPCYRTPIDNTVAALGRCVCASGGATNTTGAMHTHDDMTF